MRRGEHVGRRAATLVAVLIGAAGSECLMAYGGRHQNSRLLIGLFAAWELMPFIALGWASWVSDRWPSLVQTALYNISLVVTLASLAFYAAVSFGFLRVKVGFAFLVGPAVSLLLIASSMAIAAAQHRRRVRNVRLSES